MTPDLDTIEKRARAATEEFASEDVKDAIDFLRDQANEHHVQAAMASGMSMATAADKDDDKARCFDNAANILATIATMDPPTTLALVERIRELEAERDALQQRIADSALAQATAPQMDKRSAHRGWSKS